MPCSCSTVVRAGPRAPIWATVTAGGWRSSGESPIAAAPMSAAVPPRIAAAPATAHTLRPRHIDRIYTQLLVIRCSPVTNAPREPYVHHFSARTGGSCATGWMRSDEGVGEGISRRTVGGSPGILLIAGVARALELIGQLRTSAGHNATTRQHVDRVWAQFAQQTAVVRDD